ncbi:SUMF1/EgtB/PvdO family nonheme iron enzyme [Cronbergia sp. UHCC 0137]|uniref:SUMF1/EgtB/PvdO family nonheme iron enzyme n=1 Tax=Cronbergia sp. UHCC 0137 TaxID=3110239 RepID=UPI002B1FBBF4|nr:SUMF1/EgtB/PvdO family nonheme iron enzyme [Cronbergia sp. UHCC 0137]MEA5616250.1 SUMF1/EgtB/PvdO family nonheme iron enzyme [Cronbergia sp. UHCC 0137]
MSIIGAMVGGIAKLVGTIVPTLMAINQRRAITTQTQSLALAQKRDSDSKDLAMKRMEFDAKMEMMRQTVRAKERQEDKEFSLTLKAIEAETLLRQEKMRQAFQALEAEKQREFTQVIEKFKAEVQIALQSDNIAFQRWKTETDRQFSVEITLLNAQINRQRDKQNRDDARRDRNSPVFSVADDILQTIQNRPEMPLTVFFSPPVLRYDPLPNSTAQTQFPMMESTLSGALRELFKQYTLNQRPVKFMAGEWVTKNRRAEAAINQIFSELGSIPVLVLETEVEESFFNINIGFWNNDFDDARFETVVRKLRWQDAISEISQTLIKQWQEQGRQIQTDFDRAEFSRRSREAFTHYMEVLHCIHVGMVTDEYFLIYAPQRQLPLLPTLLPDLFDEANLNDDERISLTQAVINYCNALFDGLEQTEPAVMVELRLGWTKILQSVPSRYGFAEQVQTVMQTWLKQRGITNSIEPIIDIGKMLVPEDAAFVESLNNFLRVLGETNYLNIATSCFQRGMEHLTKQRYDLAKIDFDRTVSLNPQVDVYYQRAIACYGLKDYNNAIFDLDKAISLQPQRAEFYDLRGDNYLKLNNYEIALDNYNQAVTLGYSSDKRDALQKEWNDTRRQEEEARKRREAEAARKRAEEEEARKRREAEAARKRAEEEERKRREAEPTRFLPNSMLFYTTRQRAEEEERRRALILPLRNNLTLELVQISSGTLKMVLGLTINLSEFRMGKYPVTQAQYQAVMGTNPSHFSGSGKENHPVDSVNWHKATEFCQKLTEYLNKQGINVKIALPSETQWEYACRAGTRTKYWFGDSDSQLKNHAWYKDNSGSQTHSVKEKEDTHTNPWNLVDMHGNVWEWCADSWTSNVAFFPTNDKAYVSASQSKKLLRGGSWFNDSLNCGSGYRYHYIAGLDSSNYGFRVVCL